MNRWDIPLVTTHPSKNMGVSQPGSEGRRESPHEEMLNGDLKGKIKKAQEKWSKMITKLLTMY